jgi:hypothetical protein
MVDDLSAVFQAPSVILGQSVREGTSSPTEAIGGMVVLDRRQRLGRLPWSNRASSSRLDGS